LSALICKLLVKVMPLHSLVACGILTLKVIRDQRDLHIAREIDSQISTGRNRPTSMLEFFFMHIDRHLGTHEVLQPAGVVQMQVPDDHRLDILDVVTSRFDRRG